MKQLIDLFNKKYGKQYGVIDDSFSNEDIYKIYKIIKTLCSDDTEIMELLDKVKLPSPKTARESIEKINAEHMSEGGGMNEDVSIKNSLTVGTRIGDIGVYSVAEGIDTTASGDYSHTEGDYSRATGYASHAEGISTTASGYDSHAEGNSTIASGTTSHAEGSNTKTIGSFSHAEGDSTTSLGDNSHIEGSSSNSVTSVIQDLSSSTSNDDILTAWKTSQFSLAKGEASHVEGKNCLALGDNSHAEGYYNTATGNTSHAEGYFTKATGNTSHVEGLITTASGTSSHAEGDSTTSLGDNSHIEGKSSNSATDVIQNLSSSTTNDSIITAWNNNKFSLTKGTASHVEGFNCLALDNYSHAEGNATQALYQGSHAEGHETIASGLDSHAEGSFTEASGGYSHAEGSITKATELYSHAEGNYSEASGKASHAEGHETIASGEYSHAEGYKCKSESNSSHAEGCLTEANNFYTHAEGFYTIAKGYSQHVQGKCNIEDTEGKYAHIVGNGESETERSNAHTLDWEGNAWYAGKITVGAVPTEDLDVATKKYVDDKTALIDTTINNTLPSNGLLTLTTDKIQTTTLAVPTDITLPTVTGYTEIHLFFEGSEGVTITTGTTTVRWKTSPTISTGNLYEIVFTYINDTIGWIGDCLSYSA